MAQSRHSWPQAKREVPLVVLGNRGNDLSWWANEYEKNGYEDLFLGYQSRYCGCGSIVCGMRYT